METLTSVDREGYMRLNWLTFKSFLRVAAVLRIIHIEETQSDISFRFDAIANTCCLNYYVFVENVTI